MITGFRGKNIRGNKYFVFVRSWIFDRDILCASFDEWYKAREYARDLADRVEEKAARTHEANKKNVIYEPDDWVYVLDTEKVCIRVIWSIQKKNWVIAEKISYDSWFYSEFERYPTVEEYYADLPECIPEYIEEEALEDPGYVPIYTDTRGYER